MEYVVIVGYCESLILSTEKQHMALVPVSTSVCTLCNCFSFVFQVFQNEQLSVFHMEKSCFICFVKHMFLMFLIC